MKSLGKLKIYRTQELILDENGNHSVQVNQSVMLSKEAIDAGFLKELPDSLLSIYLYILTHIGADFSLTTTLEEISEFVPRSPIEIELALRMLENRGYIQLQEQTGVEKNYIITLATPPKLSAKQNDFSDLNLTYDSKTTSTTPSQNTDQTDKTISYILQQKAFSENDLVRAIGILIPAQKIDSGFRQEVDYWFNTFDKDVIKELIRRTDEARQRDPDINCQAYMRKIANEWIAEQIFTKDDLSKSDKLYRETRSLIEEFGIEYQKQMTRTHWQTIHNWMNSADKDDFALSFEVVKYAIQEAIRRKSDGRPSLRYIENNYIKPLKEQKVKTMDEAQKFIKKRSGVITTSSKDKLQKTKQTNQSKWQLGVDFTRFREN